MSMKNIFNVNAAAIVAAGGTGQELRKIDLFGRAPLPEQVAIELSVRTNGTAPGASKTFTTHYALGNQDNLTVAQLQEADSAEIRDIANEANALRIYTLPIFFDGQRYLYIWFDSDALAGGAALAIGIKINT